MSEAATCQSCGAPDDGGRVYCKYCKAAISAEAQRTAVPCPRCNTACRWGKQKCGHCQAWIVVACVFCGAISPCNVPNCLKCNEAFAGAPQRKAAMEAQQRQQQDMQMIGSVGSVVAPFLGAALGAAAGSALTGADWGGGGGGGPSETIEQDDYDTSNVVEDTSDVDDGGSSSDW